jgi:hypothetical protein
MKRIKYLRIFIGLIMLTAINCEKDNIETDPTIAILGKWEVIEYGNWPDMRSIEDPTGYKEFLPDSILREYDYQTGEYFYKKYWIDTLLYEIQTRNDGVQIVSPRYHYQFYDQNNKLRLDYSEIAAIFNTFILKRIN